MSTIKVDTYLTRGGVSEIAIDKLKGASSASSISIVGEGGSNTTNLQQGLAKSWCHMQGSGTVTADDSLNIASITDTATGRYTLNFSTNFGNANYVCVCGMSGNNGNTTEGRSQMTDDTPATSQFAFRHVGSSNNTTRDDANILLALLGDLA